MTLEEILNLPISKLTFMSTRAKNVLLRRIKINTLAQLDEWAKDPENQLRRIRDCGGKTVAEIVNVCHHYGITVNAKDELIAAKSRYATDDSDVQYFLIDIDDIDRSSMYDTAMIGMKFPSSAEITAEFREIYEARRNGYPYKIEPAYLDTLVLQVTKLQVMIDDFFNKSASYGYIPDDIERQFEEINVSLFTLITETELNKDKEEEN
jgi:hypothetical protein